MRSVAVAALGFWCLAAPCASAPSAAEGLLELLDWPGAEEAPLPPHDAWPGDLVERFARLSLRLREHAAALERASTDPGAEGVLQRVAGRAELLETFVLDPAARRRLGVERLTLLWVRTVEDGLVGIAAASPPSALIEALRVAPQPVEAVCVPAGRLATGEPVLVTPRVAWRPESAGPSVSKGMTLLAAQGMDLGLLEDLRDGEPLSAAEGDAFYAALAAAARHSPATLRSEADQSLAAYARAWDERPGHDPKLAAEVERLAAEGRWSVAPLFLAPLAERGGLFVFEGVVRRCVEVHAPAERGGGSYFELELFTDDSQNLPLVFCVAALPAGFPVGDHVERPARLAGFFLKRWAFAARGPAGEGGRMAAPLLVGPGPVALSPRETPRGGPLGAAAAGLFFLALAGLALAHLAWRRSDARHAERLKAHRLRTRGGGDAPSSRAEGDG